MHAWVSLTGASLVSTLWLKLGKTERTTGTRIISGGSTATANEAVEAWFTRREVQRPVYAARRYFNPAGARQ